LEVVRILNEPTAAALTYQPNPKERQRFLVYDLGGGTFDVSIVQAEQGIFEVLSSHGDTELGGDDFDQLLLDRIADEFQETYQVDLRANRSTAARLLNAVEQAKKTLSDLAVTKIEEEFIAERDGVPVHLSRELYRTEFEELIRPMLDRTMECMQRAMNDAKIQPRDIDEIVLVGGSTRTPLIAQLLEERLRQVAHRDVNPDLCVALGAAVQGAIIAGENVGSVLVDITPHSVGIRSIEIPMNHRSHLNEFLFSPIVSRNTPLPASRSELFCTVSDNQTKVEIEVYQGDSDDVRRNHQVGKFMIEGLARVPAGNQILVQMDLTLDGLLKVSAREKATGLMKHITIDSAMARFAVERRDAAQERLNQLWQNTGWNADDTSTPTADNPMSLTDLLPQDDEDAWQPDADPDDDTEGEEWKQGRVEEDDEEDEKAPSPQPRRALADAAGTDAAKIDLSYVEEVLARAAKVLPTTNDEDHATLQQLIDAVQQAKTNGVAEELRARCTELSDVLFYLEDL
jgi:molecular chaperone DnaK